jgi:hypothetical protein
VKAHLFVFLTAGVMAMIPAQSAPIPLKSPPLTSEVPFGRLFTTPLERQAMDDARRHGKAVHPQVSGVDEAAAANKKSEALESAVRQPQTVKLMGVLLRADGQNKVWISGASDHKIEGDKQQSAKIQVPLHSLNSAAILKPGQVWNPTRGHAEETYLLPVTKPVVVEPTTKLPPIQAASSAASEASASSSASSVK